MHNRTWPPIEEGILSPAYGRDYQNADQVKRAFYAGKDFQWNHPQGTTYCSIRDFQVGQLARLRYAKMSKITSALVEPEDVEDVED